MLTAMILPLWVVVGVAAGGSQVEPALGGAGTATCPGRRVGDEIVGKCTGAYRTRTAVRVLTALTGDVVFCAFDCKLRRTPGRAFGVVAPAGGCHQV